MQGEKSLLMKLSREFSESTKHCVWDTTGSPLSEFGANKSSESGLGPAKVAYDVKIKF